MLENDIGDSDDDLEGGDSESWEDDLIDMTPLELCITCLDIISCLNRTNKMRRSHNVSSLTAIIDSLLLFTQDLLDDTKQDPGDNGWSRKAIFILVGFTIRVTVSVFACLLVQSSEGLHSNIENYFKSLLLIVHQCVNRIEDDPLHIDCALISCDIVEGIWLLLHTLFEAIPANQVTFKAALSLLRSVDPNNGLDLLQKNLILSENYIEHHDSAETVLLSDRLCLMLESVTKMMISVKKAKVAYIHNMKCTRESHRHCGYEQFFHHHHNIIGIPLSAIPDPCELNAGYISTEHITSQVSYLVLIHFILYLGLSEIIGWEYHRTCQFCMCHQIKVDIRILIFVPGHYVYTFISFIIVRLVLIEYFIYNCACFSQFSTSFDCNYQQTPLNE